LPKKGDFGMSTNAAYELPRQRMKTFLPLFCFLIILLLNVCFAHPVFSQGTNESIEQKFIKQTIEKAIAVEDLAPGYEWHQESGPGIITGWPTERQTANYNSYVLDFYGRKVKSESNGYFRYYYYQGIVIIEYQHSEPYLSAEEYIEFHEERPNRQRYGELPLAYIIDFTVNPENPIIAIDVWKNKHIRYTVQIQSDAEDTAVDAFNEAERLAKLVYSRLPDAEENLSVSQSFAESHPILATTGLILGVAAGGIVLGFAAAGGATVLATGTSGIALTGVLINLPLVGSIFARLFTSQRYIRFIAPKIVPLSALTDAALEKARAFRDLLYKVSEKAAEEFSKQAKIASDVLLDDSLGPHLEETGFEEVTFSNYPPYNPQLNHSYANAKKELDAFKQAYSSADPAQLQKSIASFQAEIDKAYQIMDNARLEQLREALETHIKYANSKYSNAD
jgi:hypothetical protein